MQGQPILPAIRTEPRATLAQFALDHADTLSAPHIGCRADGKSWTKLRLNVADGALPYGHDVIGKELAAVDLSRAPRAMSLRAVDAGQAALVQGAMAADGLKDVEVARRMDAADGLQDLTGKRSRISEKQFRGTLDQAGLTVARLTQVQTENTVSPLQSRAMARQRPMTLAVAVKP